MKKIVSILVTLTASIACATSNGIIDQSKLYDKKDCDLMVSISLSQGFDKGEDSTYKYKSSNRLKEVGDLIIYDVYSTDDYNDSVEQRWLAIAEKVYNKKNNKYLSCGVIALKRNQISFKGN